MLEALGKTCPYTDYRAMLAAMLEAGPDLQHAVNICIQSLYANLYVYMCNIWILRSR